MILRKRAQQITMSSLFAGFFHWNHHTARRAPEPVAHGQAQSGAGEGAGDDDIDARVIELA
jgi:hypothetical protein